MVTKDARKLQSEIGKTYGRRDATDDVFCVIDVEASPGIPAGRWIFSTREVYLSMPPHLMSLVAGPMLLPTVKHYQIHFNNPWVNTGNGTDFGFNGNSTRENEVLSEIFQQIHVALRPIWDQNFLRGQLVLLGNARIMYAEMDTFEQNFNDGTYERVPFKGEVGSKITMAVIVSAVVGGLMTLLFLRYFTMVSSLFLRKVAKDQNLKGKLVEMAQDHKEEENENIGPKQQTVVGMNARRMKAIHDAGFHPFVVPQVRHCDLCSIQLTSLLQALLTMFVTKKLKAEATDSLARFVRDCVMFPREEQEAQAGSHKVAPDSHDIKMKDAADCAVEVPMSHFMKVYGWYCYHNAYLMKMTMVEAQRALTLIMTQRALGTPPISQGRREAATALPPHHHHRYPGGQGARTQVRHPKDCKCNPI